MKKIILLGFFIIGFVSLMESQQHQVFIPPYIDIEADELLKSLIISSLEQLFADISTDVDRSKFVDQHNYDANLFLFDFLAGAESSKKYSDPDFYKKQLINAVRIAGDQYLLSIAYIGKPENEEPIVNKICSIIATYHQGHIRFSSPLAYRTRHWKSQKVENIRYHFKDSIDLHLAKAFCRKNREIASKFGLEPDDMIFYKCSNYQEVLKLVGIDYDLLSNGKVQSSEMFENVIVSGLNSAYFAHDMVHYYIEKIFQIEERNFIAEEGYAYSLTDAYYAKNSGEIITRDELVLLLKDYLRNHPDCNLLEVYEEDKKIFNRLSPHVSVKSTITSLLCDEVERLKGVENLKTLLTCGKGMDKFFHTLDSLIGVNRSNFDKSVKELLADFR